LGTCELRVRARGVGRVRLGLLPADMSRHGPLISPVSEYHRNSGLDTGVKWRGHTAGSGFPMSKHSHWPRSRPNRAPQAPSTPWARPSSTTPTTSRARFMGRTTTTTTIAPRWPERRDTHANGYGKRPGPASKRAPGVAYPLLACTAGARRSHDAAPRVEGSRARVPFYRHLVRSKHPPAGPPFAAMATSGPPGTCR
jgi:hypothetical protein